MHTTVKRYCLPFLFSLLAISGFTQSIYQKYDIYRNPVRVILNKFSITATTGFGITDYKHQLSDVYFYQDAQNQYIFSNDIESLNGTFSGYTNWLNDPQVGFDSPAQNPFQGQSPNDQFFLANTDTASLGFRGAGRGIPIQLSIHYDFKRFRIGGGYSYEFHFLRPLKPTAFADQVRDYQPNVSRTRYSRIFGLVGYQFYEFWSYDFVAELQVGRITAGKQFSRGATSRSIYANLGVSIENNWSEYFRVVIRPSVDFKSYTVSLPDGTSTRHGYPSFFIQVGVSINIPDIPRSPMKSDHVQLKHVYTDPVTGRRMEVRGQPIWKRQNPKVGENHRKPRRLKGKNKRKLNPN